MSRTIVISPEQNLLEEVIRLLEPEEVDYSRNAVVFPGKRPAHFLRKNLGERLRRSYIPPRMFSIDAFIDFVYTELLGESRPTLEALDAVAILHSVHRESPDRLGGESFDALDAFVPLGLKMFGELEELKISGLSEREVQSSLTPFNHIYAPFYGKVADAGYTTRALKYWTVAKGIESIKWDRFRRVILAGFFALTAAERALFSRLMALDHVIFMFQRAKGIEKLLKDLGIDGGTAPGTGQGTMYRQDGTFVSHFYRSPDEHGQVFGLAALLKELLGARHPLNERTVLVLPSPDILFPVVHHALSLIPEEEYNISLGYPLTRTPIFGFLRSAMNVVTSTQHDRIYAPDYTRFALHPYTKNIALNQRTDVTRILFHTIEEFFVGSKSRSYFSLEDLEKETAMFERVAGRLEAVEAGVSAVQVTEHLRLIHEKTLRKLFSIRDVADLANKCIEIVTFLEEHSTARLHPMFSPYLQSLLDVLDAVARSRLGGSTFTEPSHYFTFLVHCIKGARVAFQGTPVQGLQVLGLLETRNLQFDRVILLDANDDVVPGSGVEQTLIPMKVRETLGLPTHRDHEAIVAYYLDLLLKSSREVHFFYVENDKKVKSRYVEQLLWEKQKSEHRGDADTFIKSMRYRVALHHDVPPPIAKTEHVVRYLKRFVYNATALDTYLRCQLQFYYGHVVNLEEKQELSGEIGSVDVGSFVHKVMAALYSPSVGRQLRPESLGVEALSRLIDDMAFEFFGTEPTGARQLMIRQVQRHLTSYVETYQLPVLTAQPVELLGIEQTIEVKRGAYVMRGRLDRVEKRGERIYVLDYKTNHDDGALRIRLDRLQIGERSSWGDAIGSLQLPVYGLLYSSRFGAPLDNIIPAYLFLGKNQIDEKIEVGMAKEGESLMEYYAATEEVLSRLLAEITDAGHPFLATEDLKHNCPSCPFSSLCGTHWVRSPGRN